MTVMVIQIATLYSHGEQKMKMQHLAWSNGSPFLLRLQMMSQNQQQESIEPKCLVQQSKQLLCWCNGGGNVFGSFNTRILWFEYHCDLPEYCC